MDWLTGPPTQEGYYFFQLFDLVNKVPISYTVRGLKYVMYQCRYVLRHKHTKKCKLMVNNGEGNVSVDKMHRRWFGPLPEPPEED